MFAVYVITLLCSISVSHSSPLACEDLVHQLDPPHLEGRWPLVAGSLSDSTHLEKFKRRDSASIYVANASDTSEMSLRRIFRFGDRCLYLQANITQEGSSFTLKEFNLTVTFLQTSCPDCLAMRFNDGSGRLLRLYLFSRRREVDQKEMEEFRAQVACLNMPPPVVMDPNKELCPEQSVTDSETKN